ncbi:TetR/AcrR family transcriptional regulator [Nevskia ramosa]|uniref:TetR/AcrR family transcriptional regulator n=2 Tax=Nevskia ramosa TaxID=64002 RepID=UPI0003B73316|nr:TetR/AcrR family transcriptional regulator [Nevskia ramosa]
MPSARSQPKPGNRQRIIEATVKLMNEHGGAVGTSQIAEFLGISPGNLYYHFRNREEILRELFDGLTRDLDEVLRVQPGESIPVERLVSCYIGGSKVLWRYRFFFASATDFISRDESLAKKYQEFSARSKSYMRLIIQGAVRDAPGLCRPTVRECEHIAETMWVVWVSWPRYSELSMPGQLLGESDIGRGLEQISFLLSPYLDAAYYQKTKRQLHRFVAELQRDKS